MNTSHVRKGLMEGRHHLHVLVALDEHDGDDHRRSQARTAHRGADDDGQVVVELCRTGVVGVLPGLGAHPGSAIRLQHFCWLRQILSAMCGKVQIHIIPQRWTRVNTRISPSTTLSTHRGQQSLGANDSICVGPHWIAGLFIVARRSVHHQHLRKRREQDRTRTKPPASGGSWCTQGNKIRPSLLGIDLQETPVNWLAHRGKARYGAYQCGTPPSDTW
jgi:hypothetical protein